MQNMVFEKNERENNAGRTNYKLIKIKIKEKVY